MIWHPSTELSAHFRSRGEDRAIRLYDVVRIDMTDVAPTQSHRVQHRGDIVECLIDFCCLRVGPKTISLQAKRPLWGSTRGTAFGPIAADDASREQTVSQTSAFGINERLVSTQSGSSPVRKGRRCTLYVRRTGKPMRLFCAPWMANSWDIEVLTTRTRQLSCLIPTSACASQYCISISPYIVVAITKCSRACLWLFVGQ